MPRIFISYRRDDSKHVIGRIYDRLVYEFGKEAIFRDLDNIGLGINFKDHISDEISECDIVLVIIGDKWISITDNKGNKRLNDPNDLVRIEVETSLNYQPSKLVIPVLVNDAKMPNHIDLPESLRQLVQLNAAIVRDDPDFHRDMDRLISTLPQNDIISYYDEIIGELNPNWTATFFPTADLTGTGVPISNISHLDFKWGAAVPTPNGVSVPGIGHDHFSARFTSSINISGGKYKFIAASDNRLRIFVDGALILDKWIGRPVTTDEVTQDLTQGHHIITVEYGHILDQSIIQVVIQRLKARRS